jgi:hypothetical protein
LRELRRRFTRGSAELRLVVVATDAVGDRTRVTKRVLVRP